MMTLGGTMSVDPAVLAQKIVRQALLNPLVVATILGFIVALTGLQLPAAVDSVLSMLGSAAAPAALFAVGVGLAGRSIDKVPPELPVLIGIKLVAHPLIVYLLLSWVGDFDPVWVHAAVLMAALPPATGVVAYARQYKSYAEWASAGVLLGTIVSIATVTVTLILLVRDIVPADPFH